MDRRLPPEYAGWRDHERAFRRLSTAELIQEVQDGSPDRRLAALSVIDLAQVSPPVIDDWIRALPDPEANELAGAIPLQRPDASCAEDVRWIGVARLGYARRRLPTFLVMLFSSLEALESRGCSETPGEWERTADWLGGVYDQVVAAGEDEARRDISLFVFENHLAQPAIFEAFCGMIARHEALALEVGLNPAHYLAQVDEARQRFALQEAAANGGVSFETAWAALMAG